MSSSPGSPTGSPESRTGSTRSRTDSPKSRTSSHESRTGSGASPNPMSDLPPESGQRPPSDDLPSNDEDVGDLIPYADEQQRFDDGMIPIPDETWESSAYGAEDEGGFLSGHESDLKKKQDLDEILPVIDRDNKYRGPASTWRHWTRHERQESSAIETSRARDLAVHLFNAYALKRRAIGFETIQNREDSDDLRAKAAAASASSFMPSNRWVAWPVPVNEVPRTDTDVFKDEFTLRMDSDNRPSAELEECLLAEMLKSAKERFEGRGWKPHRPRGRGKMKKETPKGSGIDQTTGDEEDRKSDTDMDLDVDFRPVVSADDEASKRILLPTTRHTLSQFDSLLMSLHYAREAYANLERSGADTVTETETESVVTAKTSPKKRRMRSRGRAQSRGRKRTRSSPTTKAPPRYSESGSEYEGSNIPSSQSSTSSEDSTPEEKVGRRRSASGTDRKDRLDLRDWSDVVGIASMTGWPQSVVMRTAQRCAHLFGEDMSFRTFNDEETLESEKGAGAGSSDETGTGSRPVSRKGKARAVHGTGSGQFVSRPKVFCPVEGCVRQKNGFSRTWNLNLHLKRVHSVSNKAAVGAASESDKDEVGGK